MFYSTFASVLRVMVSKSVNEVRAASPVIVRDIFQAHSRSFQGLFSRP